jgi:hypothetical protein
MRDRGDDNLLKLTLPTIASSIQVFYHYTIIISQCHFDAFIIPVDYSSAILLHFAAAASAPAAAVASDSPPHLRGATCT